MTPGDVLVTRPSEETQRALLAEHPDPRRAELRAVVADVEAALLHANAGADGAVTAAWARLVRLLALGPAPALRACPACGRLGMRAATRCSHCWARLTPPVQDEAE